MPKEKDPFRKHVTLLNNENKGNWWRCNFCGHKYNGGAQRIKAHLAGIAGFGIKGCEKVDADVKAEAAEVMRKVSEKRIQGDVRAASTSTSHAPNVEGGNNLQFPQGTPPSQPQPRDGMEEEESTFHGLAPLSDVSLDDETSIAQPPTGSTTFEAMVPPQCQSNLETQHQNPTAPCGVSPVPFHPPPPLDMVPGMPPLQPQHCGWMEERDLAIDHGTSIAQENPSAPLPSRNPQLLNSTLQDDLQGSILHVPIASDTDLSNIATANTPQHSSQPLQSDSQWGLSAPMDIELFIAEKLDSLLQISRAIRSTMGSSTLEGMPGAPTTASLFQYGRTAVQHSKEPFPSCNEGRETETNSFSLRESMDGRSPTATHVDLQSVEGEANMAGPSSSQALMPPQRQGVLHQSMNLMTAHQNPTMSSSSWGGPFTCHPPRPAVPPYGIGLICPSSVPEVDMNEGAPTTSHPYTGNIFEENRALKRKLEMLTGTAAGIREEIEFGESLSLKKVRMEVVNLLMGVEKLINDRTEAAREDCLPPHQQVDILMREAEDLRRRGKGLFEARETKVGELLERKMVGEAFQRNTTKILKYLVENQISRLGIHGMGGVGKTTIMEHIHNRLIEIANYGNVFWITVSQDVNTKSLQDKVWNALNKCKLEEEDVKKRAAMLYHCLIEKGKSTIIFDDVWAPFDHKEVGIPVRADGIKLVLTTRSLDICRQMHCQEKIKIEPLSPIEAENLFLEELGSDVALNSETQEIVKSIVDECAGLPLAVITMARSMQGVTNEFEWKDALEKLRESDMGQTDMDKKVLMKLKFSYDGLDNHDVQQCFLSCALYPEDELMDKFELIEFFIDEGLIGGLDTREKQKDRCLTILTKLENVCLLEAHQNKMKMHDLIRDMALHIMGATSIVKAGKRLTGIPPGEYWTDALEKVSLMNNDIREFPLDMSPNCPKLSTLLLNNSLWRVSVIPDSFFEKLWGLEVLNLSGCRVTEIPNSISDLVNLRALLLRRCFELRHIPCIGKLMSLRKLDARGCKSLEEIKGLETLVNLTYLDLWRTRIKRLPKGTLGGLLKLQYLCVEAPNGEDITKLVALELLQCYCEDADDFNELARVVGQSSARRYDLILTESDELLLDAEVINLGRRVVIDGWSHAIVSVGGECAGTFILIPQDVQKLKIREWDGTTNLAGMGPLECLEELKIERGENLRVL